MLLRRFEWTDPNVLNAQKHFEMLSRSDRRSAGGLKVLLIGQNEGGATSGLFDSCVRMRVAWRGATLGGRMDERGLSCCRVVVVGRVVFS